MFYKNKQFRLLVEVHMKKNAALETYASEN